MSRRAIAKTLRIAGFVIMAAGFLGIFLWKYTPLAFRIDMAVFFVGYVALGISLRLRGYKQDASLTMAFALVFLVIGLVLPGVSS